MNRDILPYAMDFASFLVRNLEDRYMQKVRHIILFGSAARGDATRRSDVDIFIDVASAADVIEKRVSAIATGFYGSQQFRAWELRGVENEVRCMVGRLHEWKDLNVSVVSDGICLFGKYKGSAEGEPRILMYWDTVRPESRRVSLSKKLYGFIQGGRRYRGLLEETGGSKIGSNCILVPLDSAKGFKKVFGDMKINARVMYIQKV